MMLKIATALTVALGLGAAAASTDVTLAKPKPKAHAAAQSMEGVIPFTALPVEHGWWVTVDVRCTDASNLTLLKWDPTPWPAHPKAGQCLSGLKPLNATTYKDVFCRGEAGPDQAPQTYVVKSRTSMTVDGEAYKFCPSNTLDPVYR